MDIIDKIEKLKAQRGWSDYKLSLESGIAQSTIATMKQRGTPPKLDVLQAICEGFGITLAQFFMEDEQVEILTEQELFLVENFRKLSPKKQSALLELVTD